MPIKLIEAAALEADLKPRPFCGGSAEWGYGTYADGSQWKFITCSECEAVGPRVDREVSTYQDACVRSWNERA